MDKQLAKQLGQEIQQALQSIAEEHNLVIEYRGGTFDPNEGWYKPKLILKSKEIGGVDRNKAIWDENAEIWGLQKDDLGETFQYKGATWTIIGLAPSRSKFPVIVQNQSGKKMVYTVELVNELLGRLGRAPDGLV